MLRSILVGFDGSPEGEDAAALSEILCEHSGGRLLLVQVQRASEPARPAVKDVELVRAESVAQGLTRVATERGAELIIVGSSSVAESGHVLAGHVAGELLRDTATPVALAPAGFRRRYAADLRRIGVGFDGSSESWTALEWAVEEARELGAQVHLLTATRVTDVADLLSPMERASVARSYWKALRKELECASRTIPEALGCSKAVLHGDPVPALLAEARRLDLTVIGSASGGPLRRVLMRSVSAALLRAARCPLLVVPSEAAAARTAVRGLASSNQARLAHA